MRANFATLSSALFAILLNNALALGQSSWSKGGPLDLDRELIKQIRAAYKAVYEVPEDVLKDLRRLYHEPSEKREASILRDLRRLYLLNEHQESAILREIRRSYEQPSKQQEDRVFREIEKLERLPEGTVAPVIQATHAEKLFVKLDLDENGTLSRDELPKTLLNDLFRWDRNRDGVLEPMEYWAYYRTRLNWLSAEAAAGRIDLELKRGGPRPPDSVVEEVESRPIVFRAGNLPKNLPQWFERLDEDKDGQVALFEWRQDGGPLEEFRHIDRNDDGFITIEEALRHITMAQPQQLAVTERPTTSEPDSQHTGAKLSKKNKQP